MSSTKRSTRPSRVAYIDRSFRNQADEDYIAARISFRYLLRDQFLWSGLQAVEKYMKAILLYHDQDTSKLGHNIVAALAEVQKLPDVDLGLSRRAQDFLAELNEYGDDRYFERTKYITHRWFQILDESVWGIRRYCQDFGRLKARSKASYSRYLMWLNSHDCTQQPHRFRLLRQGHLERVLDTEHHPEHREALVWKNPFYGPRKEPAIRVRRWMRVGTPTHFLVPAIIPWMRKRVRVGKKLKDLLKAAGKW